MFAHSRGAPYVWGKALCLDPRKVGILVSAGPEPHDSEFSHWNFSAFAELVNKNSRLSHICLHGCGATSTLGLLLTHPLEKCLLSTCCVQDSGLGAADTTVSTTTALSLCLPMGTVSKQTQVHHRQISESHGVPEEISQVTI